MKNKARLLMTWLAGTKITEVAQPSGGVALVAQAT